MESSGATRDARDSETSGKQSGVEKYIASNNSTAVNSEAGLGILPMTTVLEGDKKLVRREYQGQNWLAGLNWTGYEIHLGRTEFNSSPLEALVKDEPELAVIDQKQKVIGTYIHGWLESPEVTQKIFSLLSTETFDIPFSFQETKEREMDELGLFLEEHCEVEKILRN
jgi:adenosylcobyric acid synthase